MSRRSGGQTVVEVLRREAVDTVFTVPGESFLGILDAFYDASDLRLIGARHEQGAVNMASGWAKASRGTGVCLATRGVGASNLTIGLHTAQQDSTPLVALIGQVPTSVRGREALQEMDLADFYSHVTKWSIEVTRTDRLGEHLQRAFRRARRGRPGPVLVSLPMDVLSGRAESTLEARSERLRSRPDEDHVDRALERLLGAERPAILAGGGVLRAEATDTLLEFAETTRIPVFSAFRRHDVFPNSHPLYLGCSALGSAEAVTDRLRDSDVLLAIGTRLSQVTTQDYTVPGEGTSLIHSDVSGEVIGNTHPADVPLLGDARLVLRDLIEKLGPTIPNLEQREKQLEEDRSRIEPTTRPPEDLSTPNGQVHPARVIQDLNDLLPPDAAVVSDAGNFYGWMNRYYRFEEPQTFYGPTSGAMGYSLPAALGVQCERPDKRVVSLAGDGGMMMVLQELETAVQYDLPVIGIVFNNRMHGTIRMHQEQEYPGRSIATDLLNPDFRALAESFGALGERVETNEAFAPALKRVLEAGEPALIEVVQDPELISVSATLDELRSRGSGGT